MIHNDAVAVALRITINSTMANKSNTTTAAATPQASRSSKEEAMQRWHKTWSDFQRALRSAQDPFNPFAWIYRLAVAGLDALYHQSRLNVIVEKYRLCKIWPPLIPLFVVSVIMFLILLYIVSARFMVLERWCNNTHRYFGNDNANIGKMSKHEHDDESNIICLPMVQHDFFVAYFGLMVLYHYFKTNLSSPGVALPSYFDGTKLDQASTWKCTDGRGGFYGSMGRPKLNVEDETQRTALYGKLSKLPLAAAFTTDSDKQVSLLSKSNTTKNMKTANNSSKQQTNKASSSVKVIEFPSPGPSFCRKCNILRPPRCHHCRVCNRCVLQFDHHCLWVNNCIGYNNYRSFLALLFHIVLACWYCLAVMVVPFYELIRQEQARQMTENNALHGNGNRLFFFYKNSQFFEDIPKNPLQFLRLVTDKNDGLHWTLAIKLAYPFLLGIGTVMTLFLGFHIRYCLQARTTLEHKVILEVMYDSLWEQAFSSASYTGRNAPEVSIKNPFDQGTRKNLEQILGPNFPSFFLLPISSATPGPFVPNTTASGERGKKNK